LAHSPDYGDTWELLTPIPGGTVYSMSFPTSLIGYAAGFDGIFLKTVDGGQTWKGGYLTVGLNTLNIQTIQFLDENNGFAACSYQMVAKTTDGGNHWTAIIPDTNSATVTSYGVCFLTPNYGFVVGKVGSGVDVIYKTVDGGATWIKKQNITSKDLRAVDFADLNHGIIVGYSLKALYTTDGGDTWNTPTISGVSGTPNVMAVKFMNATDAIAVGVNFMMKTTDAGATWNFLPSNSANQLNGVAFANETTGFAVGAKEAWKTDDAGNTWSTIYDTNVFDGTLYSAVVDPEGNAWFGGASSGIFTNRVWVGVEKQKGTSLHNFSLQQNYPNPFNPSTTINYFLPSGSFVSLEIYDVLGNHISTLVNEFQAAGNYAKTFSSTELSNGIYFYRLKANGVLQTKKMLLLK